MMTPLPRLLCVLTLLLMAGLGPARASMPAGAIAAGYGTSFAALDLAPAARSVAARNGASRHGVPTSRRAAAETVTPPVIDIVDFAGFEPYVRKLLPALRDIAEFGPLVPDPAPLAIFGIALILLGFLRRYFPV